METKEECIWGIDISKDWLDISINNQVTRIDQTKDAINTFIKKYAQERPVLAILESTGGYEKLAANCLIAAGKKVHIAHPNRVRDYAKAKGCLAKTDSLDARILEGYGSFIEPDALRAPLTEAEQKLAELNGRLAQMKQTHHQECCRSRMVTDKFVKKSIKSLISVLENGIKKLESHIKKIILESEELSEKFQLLKTMKGVGDTLAITLIADLPELGKLTNKQIAALVGVAPITKQSGKKSGKASTQYGRSSVRKVLYMAALVAAHRNPRMMAFYKKMLERGKQKKVALVAVMRKMIVTLNAMISAKSAYISEPV